MTQTEQPGAKRKTWILTLGAGIIALSLILYFTFSFYSLIFGGTLSGSYSGEGRGVSDIHSDAYVAVLHINGVISENDGYSYDQSFFLDQVEELMYDSRNIALVLYVDSPGGYVYQIDELYLKLAEYKKNKPIYTYMGSIAASGGYYLGCMGKTIAINRNGMTGSIGVVSGTVYDLSEFLASHGIKATTIHSGANKTMGDFTQPFTAEQQAIYQSILDEAYNQFISIIVEERGMPPEQVLPLADGRVYSPMQALDNGLVDYIATYPEYQDMVLEDLNTDAPFENIFYSHIPTFADYLGMAKGPRTEAELLLSLVQNKQAGLAYLYSY